MKNVFIRVGGSVSIADAVAHLERLGYVNRWSAGFYPPSTTATISGDECGLIGWCKLPDWCEENEYDETFISPKHKHYDLIVKWLKDPLQGVWAKINDKWVEIDVNTLVRDAIGHHVEIRVQHESTKRKIMIGDIEIDAPVASGLTHGDEYYLPDPSMPELYSESRWTNDHYDKARLKRGLVHLNKEAAIAHAMALIALTGECE